MATNWQHGGLWFDLNYWVKRPDKDLTGTLQFDIRCEQLEYSQTQKSAEKIAAIVLEKCEPLLDFLRFKHGLGFDELLELIVNTMIEHEVNADTIESDSDRKNRLANFQRTFRHARANCEA